MNEQTNSVILNFLDEESKFHYLNYYYSKMLDETNDEEYFDKLSCLYQSWEQEILPMLKATESYHNEDYTYDSDDDSDY